MDMDEINEQEAEVMNGLAQEQIQNAKRLAEYVEELTSDELDPFVILDGLASLGLQILPIVGENIPSLAMITLLGERGEI